MINPKELKEMLSITQEDLSNLSTDQLKDCLGVFRYCTRAFEREINQRENLTQIKH